jgi:pimeloyl-ACP methyl ester carboxylesterase
VLIEARTQPAYWPTPHWSRSLNFHCGQLPGEPADATFEVVAGARVHYVDRGSGEPVVLLHGFASSLEIWSHLISELAREHRVVAVDLKGFGWTDRPEGDYSPRAQAQLVWALLEKRGIERAALVGHSWGASVALAMALSAPERTTRIGLYDAWAYEAQLSFAFRWSRSIGVGEMLLRLYDSNWARSQLALGFHKPGQLTPDLVKKLKARMDRPGARAAALATLRGMHFVEQQARYTTLRRPALVLWGQDDSIAAPAFGRHLASDLAGELVVFPRCGHFPMIEATEASNAALKSFLRSPGPAPHRPAEIRTPAKLP